ncbi:hypothetical protein HSBAA_62020 [Vreelandella sulfidaeris]|uniref:Uncharacterized protein n=1 Tax=Vreelandella sulfidaeris TaxID=115553 RepID=A0A455UF40_9GAMM|nr:hypothetical protein HSBAA_62020 [Halomonas sulfidaeris]
MIESIPCDVGVSELTKRNTLSIVKNASNNSSEPVDIPILMKSLRLNEYKEMVRLATGRRHQRIIQKFMKNVKRAF